MGGILLSIGGILVLLNTVIGILTDNEKDYPILLKIGAVLVFLGIILM